MKRDRRAYNKRYQRKHRKRLRKYRREYRRRRREFIRQIIRNKKRRPCSDCGRRYPYYVMEFDHVRGKKKFQIGEFYSAPSLAKLLLEMEKCDLVCSNCHKERTHQRSLR